MIDSLCQGYHWSFDEAVKRTIPQIILLNHAAHVNSERMKARMDSNDEPNQAVMHGKAVEDLDDSELDLYFKSFSSAFS